MLSLNQNWVIAFRFMPLSLLKMQDICFNYQVVELTPNESIYEHK